MAEVKEPADVALICGMLAGQASVLDAAEAAVVERFGPIALTSPTWPFEFTDYYADEMGAALLRRFVAFEKLARPEALADGKLWTNEIERRFAEAVAGAAPERPVNLDIGYVTPAKLVLASMKDFSHRVYLGRGVFAEITLLHRGGRWSKLDWTFPDYASGRYDGFLEQVRTRLKDRLRETKA